MHYFSMMIVVGLLLFGCVENNIVRISNSPSRNSASSNLASSNLASSSPKVFDVHVHAMPDRNTQVEELWKAGVYKVAISSAWADQNKYRDFSNKEFIYGLMFPCPVAVVPYSNQKCFDNGYDWPQVAWVEAQIIAQKIDYFGELLNQYYGISPTDARMEPYYQLAQQYQLPIGVHTGGAGPNHGSPHFKLEMGNPNLWRGVLDRYPNLKIWLMHGGVQFYKEALELMKKYPQVYADLSVISVSEIIEPEEFSTMLQAFIANGLEDRLMFGSDNADINKMINAILNQANLTPLQKEKIFYRNAEVFFKKP